MLYISIFLAFCWCFCLALSSPSPSSLSDVSAITRTERHRLRRERRRHLEEVEHHQKLDDYLNNLKQSQTPPPSLPRRDIPPGRYCKTSKRRECIELFWHGSDETKEVNVMYSDGRSVRPATTTNHTWVNNSLYDVTVHWPEEDNKIPTSFAWNLTTLLFNNVTNQSSEIHYLNGKEKAKGKFTHYYKWKWSPVDVEVALITDTTDQDKINRGYVFLDETFPDSGLYHPNTYLWSGVWTEECPTHAMENTDKDHNGTKIIGTTMAHYQIWQEFYRRYQDSDNPQQRIIIFEDDAECAIPNCGDVAIKQLQKVTADIVWLGWCWYYGGLIPPFCLHAYSLTVKAVRVLLQNVFPCVRPGDNFIADLGREGVLSWTLANVSSQFIQGKYSGKETHDVGETKGLFTQKQKL